MRRALLILVILALAGSLAAPAAAAVAVDDEYLVTPTSFFFGDDVVVFSEVFSPAAPGVLANDSGSGISVKTVSAPSPDIGTLSWNTNGSFTYNTDPSFAGDVTFTYTAQGGGDSTATVTLTINPSPASRSDSAVVAPSGVIVLDVLANDADPNAEELSVAIASGPSHGTAVVQIDEKIRYAHGGGPETSDSFTYMASDGSSSSVATVVQIAIVEPLPPGTDDVGLVDTSTGDWHLLDPENGTTKDFIYGNPGDVPFMGDWNCDGVDTPGLFRPTDAFAYLRNSNSTGIADVEYFFGNPSDVPLAGDFDGDCFDTLSIYRPAEARFYIINKLGSGAAGVGAADFSFLFGNPGDVPFVGDFDNDGIDEVALFRPQTSFVYYRQTLNQGAADNEFFFGDPGDLFVAADWNGDGGDAPAIFRPADRTFYFRFLNTQGPGDRFYPFGDPAWLPVAGNLF